MTATFLVTVNVPDTNLMQSAVEIQSDLEQAGHEILSVKPWARPSDPNVSPFALPPSPTNTTQNKT